MGVGINYTNINGRTTSFSSESVVGAMERLSSIPGYLITPTEQMAGVAAREALGKGKFDWGKSPVLTNGTRRSTIISDIKMKNGKLVKVTENGFRSADGSFIPSGGRSELPIENIGGN